MNIEGNQSNKRIPSPGGDGAAPVGGKSGNGRQLPDVATPRPSVQDQKKSRRGEGAGQGVMARVLRRHPGNPKAQVTMFFQEFVIKAGTGRERPVSARTHSAYVSNLILMIDELGRRNAAVRNVNELSNKHALHLMRHWKKMDLSSATIELKLSILRRFLTFIGKGHLVPTRVKLKTWLQQNGIEPPPARTTVATVSKAWEEKGIDLEQLLPQLEKICPITAIQLEIQAAFGLRMRESLRLDPSAADLGNVLLVVHGTKGGLPRTVPFDADPAMREWQRDVLERAKLMAEKNTKGLLARPGYTLDQNVNHFYYVVRRVGITKRDLGVTAHGLRHQYAARRYKHFSGLDVPISAAAPQQINEEVREADRQARRTVSRELGHLREDVPQAYVGSLSMLERKRGARVRQWVQLTEGNPEFCKALATAGVGHAWLAGNFARGADVGPTEKLVLIVATAQRQPLAGSARAELRERLNQIIERGVTIYEHLDAGEPDDKVIELHIDIDK